MAVLKFSVETVTKIRLKRVAEQLAAIDMERTALMLQRNSLIKQCFAEGASKEDISRLVGLCWQRVHGIISSRAA